MATPLKNIPKADNLMGSMRSMGYNFESAIADVVDNSISANCSVIQLFFPTRPEECYVEILDDGIGMTREELINGMRYGSRASEDARSEDDLGRFGLGLKAASLSQCRKLTVVSKLRGSKTLSAFQWDYNYILEHGDWYMLELTAMEIGMIPNIEKLQSLEGGTLVLWEDFDIIEKSSNGQVYHTLCEYKEKINRHIGLIFHRFINGTDTRKVQIVLNHNRISALDPFLERKSTSRKEFQLELNDSDGVERYIKVRPFILPFLKDLDPKDIEKLGGAENLRTKQGFYIYRNHRLIIWGTWFGLQRSELTKNARILVDIPNTLDDIWSIDIRKQQATIPKSIQNRLKRAVADVMETSVRQHVYRGRLDNGDNIERLWNRMKGREDAYYYEINRESLPYKFLKEKISEEAMEYVDMYIQELERNIPLYEMYLDQSNNAVMEKEEDKRSSEVFIYTLSVLDSYPLFGKKVTKESIEELFETKEPFCNNKKLLPQVLAYYEL